MPRIPQVALLIDTSTDYSTRVIQGVDQYMRSHRPWQLLVQPRGERERALMPKHWQPVGVIARVTHRALAVNLHERQIPVVNVSLSEVPGLPFPKVTIDELLVGAWAATHLWQRGFRHFGYCGLWRQPNYVDSCGPAFAAQLTEYSPTSRVWMPRKPGAAAHSTLTIPLLQSWLKRLPKPVGILAVDAEDAHNLVEACHAGGHHVPDDIAIIVGEDDRLLCEISHPPLASIDLNSERIGYEAAALLDRLLNGRQPPEQPIYLPPLRVIPRQSTDTLAMEDRDLALAVRYIREHAGEPLGVLDVLKQVPLARRTLEQRFLQVLGLTPAAEIRRVRIERAKDLLISTDWPIPKIASSSGFASTEVMNRLFRRELDVTPTQFRTRSRLGRGSLHPAPAE